VNYALFLQREGYRASTIQRHLKVLRNLPGVQEHPDIAKTALARSSWSQGVKELASNVLEVYYTKYQKVPFTKPIYRRIEKIPFLPTTEEAVDLISGLTRQIATFCTFLKETGARAGEAHNVRWGDIYEGYVKIQPGKHSNPRRLKLSPRLLLMINLLPRKSERTWGHSNLHDLSANLFKQRKTIALNQGNPRLRMISFHSFLRLKASVEYHATKDIVPVQRLLGHKSIASTLKYVQLIDIPSDEWICKAATAPEEAAKLIEAGFTFETALNGVSLFKKRK
jgi:integrase